MAFAAETGSGHLVAMDGAPEGGGRNLAPRPMEMVLLGTGGCTAYDVVMILKKSRQEIAGRGERAAEIGEAIERVRQAASADDIIVITGSLFLVGEARAYFTHQK